MQSVISDQYDIERFVANSGLPLEIVSVRALEPVAIPVSFTGKTRIRYAGQAPAVNMESDKFENACLLLKKGSAVEVMFTSHRHPAGKIKVFVA